MEADLEHPPLPAPTVDRQTQVAPRHQHQVKPRRSMLDQRRQVSGHNRLVDEMHVVDDDDDITAHRIETIEQLCDHVGAVGRACASAAPAGCVHPGATCSSAARKANQNCGGSRSESSSDSHESGDRALGRPASDQRRLAGSGRGDDDRQRLPDDPVEQAVQAPAMDEVRRQRRGTQPRPQHRRASQVGEGLRHQDSIHSIAPILTGSRSLRPGHRLPPVGRSPGSRENARGADSTRFGNLTETLRTAGPPWRSGRPSI